MLRRIVPEPALAMRIGAVGATVVAAAAVVESAFSFTAAVVDAVEEDTLAAPPVKVKVFRPQRALLLLSPLVVVAAAGAPEAFLAALIPFPISR